MSGRQWSRTTDPHIGTRGCNSTKKHLNAFLHYRGNKRRGEINQFTSEAYQISYALFQLMTDRLKQIRGTYTSYTTIQKRTSALKAVFGDPNHKGTAQRLVTALQ